jgi:hypothetical protein
MEVRLPAMPDRFRALSRGQRLASLLLIGLLASAVLGTVVYRLAATPLIEADYSPFGSQQEYEAFYKAHRPLTEKAPDGANFRYKSSITAAKQPLYQIYLRTPAVRPDTAKAADYAKLLRQYQSEAKSWFGSQGEDLDKAYIQWIPNPASYEPTPTPTPHLPIGGTSKVTSPTN